MSSLRNRSVGASQLLSFGLLDACMARVMQFEYHDSFFSPDVGRYCTTLTPIGFEALVIRLHLQQEEG